MKKVNNSIQYSASDLVNFLGCKHLTQLDRELVLGTIKKPVFSNPSLEFIQKKGEEHEKAYVDYLISKGLNVIELDGQSVKATFDAMAKGYDIISQARFEENGWVGIADILRKVKAESNLGTWSYEITDTKLARETKAGTVLQLCLYSELLGSFQGHIPENMYVVKPGEEFEIETFRFPEFEAYYKSVKNNFQRVILSDPLKTYPMPVAKCDTCRWWKECMYQWRKDDHLSLIAGIRSGQILELNEQEINRLDQYAKENYALKAKPKRGNSESYERIHQQAKIQLKGRLKGELLHELLPSEPMRGLNRLPVISKGDLYFDIEGDHFYEDGGLEYLFGVSFINKAGGYEYKTFWAKNRDEERVMFDDFIKFVLSQLEIYPDLHIYHYAPYEPTAVKRLASRCALHEMAVDDLLRKQKFVDLFKVIKESLIASVESYSLKETEKLATYMRLADLRMASDARRRLSIALDFNDFSSISEAEINLIERYNEDDCRATLELHSWLERLFVDESVKGNPLVRFVDPDGEVSEELSEKDLYARGLYEKLIEGIPEDRASWNEEQRALWLLAHQVEFYRREMRSAYWEFFRMRDLEAEELYEERNGIAGLVFTGAIPGPGRLPTHRYSFPAQESTLSIGNTVNEPQGESIGTVINIDLANNTIDIKKSGKSENIHPTSIFVNDIIKNDKLVPAFHSFVEEVIQNGFEKGKNLRAGKDLLINYKPRLISKDPFHLKQDETDEFSALRLVLDLDNSVLPVQGPPGTGKTYIGGCIIAELVKRGKKVGVTAVSHKVIRNLLDKTVELSLEKGIKLEIRQYKSKEDGGDPVTFSNKEAAQNYLANNTVVGGTAWFWVDDSLVDSLDYLFVDEAGQMSLTNVLTVARAAKNIILLGDPQQLEQPIKGAHPERADISALEHILDGHKTMPENKGLFLGTTWRMHPLITKFTSVMYYEDRLNSVKGLEKQKLTGSSSFNGSGLFYVPVDHQGNQSQSSEEVLAVKKIVDQLLNAKTSWIDREGNTKLLESKDIKIIAPYNAQVSALKIALPEYAIGTVDKFQGQEAPVVIYSMTSSSSEDAPRGMSFLYNPNRTNVATSRAKCICILVASPRIFEVECNTIEQMKWANGMCLFKELASEIII